VIQCGARSARHGLRSRVFVVECDQHCMEIEQAGKGGVGVVVGKSGVAAVCLGWMAIYACLTPCQPDTHPPVAPSTSLLSPEGSFRSVVNDQSGGAQGVRRPEKGEECIRPACRLLSYTHRTRGGHLGHLGPFELLPFPSCTEGGPCGTPQNRRMIGPAPLPL